MIFFSYASKYKVYFYYASKESDNIYMCQIQNHMDQIYNI